MTIKKAMIAPILLLGACAVAPAAQLQPGAGKAMPSAGSPVLNERDARTIECIVKVDQFIARISAEGPVAGPTWQVRDWWDKRSWDIDERVRERELEKARAHAAEFTASRPADAEAAQTDCVQEAIDNGAVAGL